MLITRVSPLTGVENTLDIDVTEDQIRRWQNKEDLIQRIMPNLTADEREFIMIGYTAEDWDKLFPED